MRSMVRKVVGGLVFAACLVAGLPVVAEDPPEDAVLVAPECRRPGSVIWKRQLGTPSGDFAWGVATDKDGNVVIGGYTLGSLGGPNRGANDAFVAKYSTDGKLLWKRQPGTPEGDGAQAVATDAAGNVMISGFTVGSQGKLEAFVAKYSTDGKLLWKRQLGTPFEIEEQESTSVATDKDGNVSIAGIVGDYGCGECLDVFVARYAASGKLLWKRRLRTATDDGAGGVATDAAGNVLIAGMTSGSLGGEPNQGFQDAFVAKYSPSGKLMWTRQLGTPEVDSANGVATDAAGNVVIGGWTLGSLAGPNQGGGADAFVAKYSGAGKLLWKRQLGRPFEEQASFSVATDQDGNVVIGGSTGSRFGPTQGGPDAFVAKFSAAGKLLWSRRLGTPEVDLANGVATDAAGNILIGGFTRGSLGGVNRGDLDVFVAKLRP